MAAGYTKHIIMAKVISPTGKALRQIDKFAREGKLPKGYETIKMSKSSDYLTITGKCDDTIFQWMKCLKNKEPMTCVKYASCGKDGAMWNKREEDIEIVEILESTRVYELDIDYSILEDMSE